MNISSNAFEQGGSIPNEYSMYGANRIPSLILEDVPTETKSLALIVDDPDAPKGTFTHWLLFNVPSQTTELGEGKVPPDSISGTNDFGKTGYGGPRPPSGEHRYFFNLYALDSRLALTPGVKRSEIEAAMQGHILAKSVLMGRFAA